MKTRIKNFSLLPVFAGVGLMLAGRVSAQTFTTLHSFSSLTGPYYTNSDGAGPKAGLIVSGSTLYGTTAYGGSSSSNGTVFRVNTDGTGFKILHSFTFTSGPPVPATDSEVSGTNSDGAMPETGLVLSGNTLYGTTFYGGSEGYGTVFSVNTDGTGFTTLHSFTTALAPSYINIDGFSPSGLAVSGNTLYGTAARGGSSANGTVFRVDIDGTRFAVLHSFTYLPGPYYTNSDGIYPSGLVVSGNTLYGTASDGGSSGQGTVFVVNTDGTGFTVLRSFGYGGPVGLILSGNTLYGTTRYLGTVFGVNIDGTGFTTLRSFPVINGSYYTNSDGFALNGSVGNTLYGTADVGGSAGNGTVFALHTDGTGFTVLHSFTALAGPNYTNSDGGRPNAELALSGNTLYGTTYYGGSFGYGTVFSVAISPQLSILPTGGNVILTWPTNFSGFTLQSTTNLGSAGWTNVSLNPVVIGEQKVVVNPTSGTQQFYRLSHIQ